MLATVSIRSFFPLLMFAQKAGLEASAFLADAGLGPTMLARPELRLPLDAFQRAFTLAAERLDDPALGLRVAEAVDFRILGAFAQASDFLALHHMISCATVGDALEAIARTLPIAYGPVECRFERNDDSGVFRYSPPPEEPPLLTEHIVGIILCALRVLATRPLLPVEVFLPHARPADTRDHARVLGPALRFDAPHAGFAVNAVDLQIPLVSANARVHEALEQRVTETLRQLVANDFVASVRATILREIPYGNPLAGNVAMQLGMSTRTLARYLAAEGTTHHAILDDVRKSLTARYLGEQRGVTAVARLVGFSSLSAFHRAFRRWYGVPPADWRDAAVASR